MQNIKIFFSIKVYFFLLLLSLLFQIPLLDFSYLFYGFSQFFLFGVIGICITIIHIVLLFLFFKSPKKYSTANISFILLFLVISIISSFYNHIISIFILFDIYFLFKFIQFKRFLSLPEGEKKDKYVKFSGKKQYKGIFILYLTLVFGLLVFYFTYYTSPIVDFKRIDDSYFENNHKYKDINDADNAIEDIKNYAQYLKELDYQEDGSFYRQYTDPEATGSLSQIKFEVEKVKAIDAALIGIDEILKKKAIVDKTRRNTITLPGFSGIARSSIYNIIYHIENGNERKGIEYITQTYKLGNKVSTGYNGLRTFIQGMTIQAIAIYNLEFILDNYTLSNEELKQIKNTIQNTESIENSYKYSINHEYHNQLLELTKYVPYLMRSSIILASKNQFHEGLKNIYHWFSITDNELEIESEGHYIEVHSIESESDISEKYLCNKKYKEKLNSGVLKGKIKFLFKKNFLSNTILNASCISVKGYYHDLKVNMFREEGLLQRINQLLKLEKDINSIN